MPESPFLEVEEVAEILRSDGSTVRRWFAEDKLRGTKIGGKILISRADVEAIVDRGTCTTEGATTDLEAAPTTMRPMRPARVARSRR